MRRDRLTGRRTSFKLETRAWAIAASGKLGALALARRVPADAALAPVEVTGREVAIRGVVVGVVRYL
jgi:hypothetical protein